MKVLLLGANGQVGHELRRSLASLGEIVPTTRSGLLDGKPCERADLDQPDSLAPLLQRVVPDVVINAAAYTAVDRAEDDTEAAWRANAESPGALARTCASLGMKLVHYSTDYVFDGSSSVPYTEDAATGPLGVYGQSKLAGEQAVRQAAGQHLVFRTAWVYGVHGNNFLRTMLRLATDRDELRVVSDQVGTPTPAYLIADVTARAISEGLASGTYHLTASGSTSWYGFAAAIFSGALERGLIPKSPALLPIATSEYPTRARRPAYSLLDNSHLQRVLGRVLPEWRACLDQVLDDFAALESR